VSGKRLTVNGRRNAIGGRRLTLAVYGIPTAASTVSGLSRLAAERWMLGRASGVWRSQGVSGARAGTSTMGFGIVMTEIG
jgi:hypothetical protein